ncbi:MAG: CapA family protein [Clostridia bacterium]|nr:CapA family protein [Clostridia bacterium]
MNKKTRRQKAIIRRRIFLSACALSLALVIALIVFIVKSVTSVPKMPEAGEKSSDVSSSEPAEPYIVSTATVINTGDIMVHSPQLNGALNKSTGEYDFSAFFKYISPYIKSADYSVANLEVTFGGKESGQYSGYPAFNTPDSLADAIKQAGFSLLLTSNNHCYDTGLYGVKRTLEVLEQKGIPYTGTRLSADREAYTIKEINGINMGFACFTYENTNSDTPAGRKSLNGNIISTDANNLINSFSYNNLDAFYSQAQNYITSMKNSGADCIIFYMHWGEEYQLTQNTWQKTIAQKLCNMGVDVIVGGHPHVIQPMELLYSEDSQNTTVCIYSLGNAVSNQRQEIMAPECTTGHTEDGLLFSYTFDKYSDGTTLLSDINIIPTWVDKYPGGNGYLYSIYPLENKDFGISNFGLSGTAAAKSSASYDRTMAIVSQGFEECKQYLK